MIGWLKGNTLARNLVLGVAAVVLGAFVTSTTADEAFKVDTAAFAAAIWVAIRGGAVLLGLLLDRLKKST
jgi:hypothetical protein